MAGGVGSRFWPVSTPERPKQLLPLAGPRPLVRDTVDRARTLVPDDRIRILAGDHLADAFRGALPDLPASSYMVEPRARGTAPVLAWAAWELRRSDPDAVLVSLHSDHIIEPLDAFRTTVLGAAEIARSEGLLLTVGAVPDRIETGYGHIQPGPAVPGPEGIDAFRVTAFHEKPDAATARRYGEAGYLWNTGIFVWSAATFLEELEAHAPEVAACLPLLEDGPERFFEEVPSCVVDRAVLERSARVACVRASFDWDDIGSWNAMARTREADGHGNVLHGDARVVEGRDNVVWADQGQVVLWGVRDLVVVRTGDRTLVLPRDRAPHLKDLLNALDDER
ncbi:MAG: sugar phosphate nucleotidyltransferase [Longimicrobiales bacterium]